jgi:hypothetical protein
MLHTSRDLCQWNWTTKCNDISLSEKRSSDFSLLICWGLGSTQGRWYDKRVGGWGGCRVDRTEWQTGTADTWQACWWYRNVSFLSNFSNIYTFSATASSEKLIYYTAKKWPPKRPHLRSLWAEREYSDVRQPANILTLITLKSLVHDLMISIVLFCWISSRHQAPENTDLWRWLSSRL